MEFPSLIDVKLRVLDKVIRHMVRIANVRPNDPLLASQFDFDFYIIARVSRGMDAIRS